MQRDTIVDKEAANRPVVQEEADVEIELVELFYRLIEKLKYIVAASVLFALLALLITVFGITPKYSATSKLYVTNAKDSAINLSDLQIGTYLAADYQEVFQNWHVHERVIQRLNLPYSYKQLSDMLSVTNPSGTRILYISITAEDPDEAKLVADTYAKVAQEFITATMETEEPNIFQEALKPSAPSSPSLTRNVVLGFLLGMLFSCGVIVVMFITDDRIRTSEDIERYIELPTLGVVSLQSSNKVMPKNKKRRTV